MKAAPIGNLNRDSFPSQYFKVSASVSDSSTRTISANGDSPQRSLDEPIWQQLPAYDEFVVIDPDTLGEPPHGTRVRFFYDDKNLYVGIVMDQPDTLLHHRFDHQPPP